MSSAFQAALRRVATPAWCAPAEAAGPGDAGGPGGGPSGVAGTGGVVYAPGDGGPLERLGAWPTGVVLHLHPPGLGLPVLLLAAAVGWLRGGPGGPELAGEAGTVPFRIDVDAAADTLAAAAAAQSSCVLVRGERDGRVRGVSLHQRFDPVLLLAAGGAAAGVEDLAAEARVLQGMARALTPALVLAYLSVEPALAGLRQGEAPPEPGRHPATQV